MQKLPQRKQFFIVLTFPSVLFCKKNKRILKFLTSANAIFENHRILSTFRLENVYDGFIPLLITFFLFFFQWIEFDENMSLCF